MNRDFDQVPFSRRSFFALAVLPIALGSAPAFAAADAESFVSSVGNGVLAAARSNSVGQFRSILNSSADVRTIAIYSLGPYRKNLTKDLERQYVALVEDYISKVFASHSKSLAGQKLEVIGSSDAGDSTMVRSEIVFGGGRSVPVTWRLIRRGGGYRVFDVNVDGVWLASTQKTNFTSVLKKSVGDISALLAYLQRQ